MKRKADNLDRLLGRKRKKCNRNLSNSFVPEQILCPPDRVHSLQTLTSKVVATHIPFELIEKRLPSIPEPVLEKIIFFSFPQNESDIYFYSCQSHIDKKKSLNNINTDAEKLPFNLGLNILDMGLVQDVTQIGFHLSGTVADQCRHITPKHCRSCCGYKVSVSFDRGKITSVRCACGGKGIFWCQHVVALILFRIRRPTQVAFRKPISDSLDQLDRIQLQKLTQYLLAASTEDLVPHAQAIVDELMAPRSKINQIWGAPDPTGGVSISQTSNWYLDENQVREQVRHHLANLVSSNSIGNLHMGSFAAASLNVGAAANAVGAGALLTPTNSTNASSLNNPSQNNVSSFFGVNSQHNLPVNTAGSSTLRGLSNSLFQMSSPFLTEDNSNVPAPSGGALSSSLCLPNGSASAYGPVMAISLMCDKVRQMFARSDPNGTRMLAAMTKQFLKDPRLQSFKLRRTEMWQDYHRMWQEITALWLTVLANPIHLSHPNRHQKAIHTLMNDSAQRQQWLFQLRRWSQHPICPTEHMGFHYGQGSTDVNNAFNDSDASSNSGGSSSVSTIGTASILDENDADQDGSLGNRLMIDFYNNADVGGAAEWNVDRGNANGTNNSNEPRSVFHYPMDSYYWSWDSPLLKRIIEDVSEDEDVRTRVVFNPTSNGENFSQVCHRVYTLFCHGHLLSCTALALALCRHIFQEWYEQITNHSKIGEEPHSTRAGQLQTSRFNSSHDESGGRSSSISTTEITTPGTGDTTRGSQRSGNNVNTEMSQPISSSTFPRWPPPPSSGLGSSHMPLTPQHVPPSPSSSLSFPYPPHLHTQPHHSHDHSLDMPYITHGWVGLTGNPLVCIIECLLECRNSPLVTRHTWSVDAMDMILADGCSYLTARNSQSSKHPRNSSVANSGNVIHMKSPITHQQSQNSYSGTKGSALISLGVGRLSCEDLLLCCAFQLALIGLCQQRLMPLSPNCQEKALSQESHLLAVLEQMMPVSTSSGSSSSARGTYNGTSNASSRNAASTSSGSSSSLSTHSAPSFLLFYSMVATVRLQLAGNWRSGLAECVHTESFPMHRAALYIFPRLLSADQELAFTMACRALRLPVLEARSDSEENLDLLLLLSEHRSRWSVMRQIEASQCELALLMLLRGANCSKPIQLLSLRVQPSQAPTSINNPANSTTHQNTSSIDGQVASSRPGGNGPTILLLSNNNNTNTLGHTGASSAPSANSNANGPRFVTLGTAANGLSAPAAIRQHGPGMTGPNVTNLPRGWNAPQQFASQRFSAPTPQIWPNNRPYLPCGTTCMGPPPPPLRNLASMGPPRVSVSLSRHHSMPSNLSSSHIRVISSSASGGNNISNVTVNNNASIGACTGAAAAAAAAAAVAATQSNTSTILPFMGGCLLQQLLYMCDRHIHTALSLYHLSQEVMNKASGNATLSSAAYHLALSVCRRTLQSLNWRRREMLQYTVSCALENGVNAVLYLLTNWWYYVKPREAVFTVLPAIMSWGCNTSTLSSNNKSESANSAVGGGTHRNNNNGAPLTQSINQTPMFTTSPLMKDERVLQAWRQVLVHVVLRDPIHCSIQALSLCDKDPLTFDSLVRLITEAAEQGSIGCVQLFLIARYLRNEGGTNGSSGHGNVAIPSRDVSAAGSMSSSMKAFRLALQAVRMTRLTHLQDRHPSTNDILWCCNLAQSIDVQAIEEFLQHVIRNIQCPSLLSDILQRCIYQQPPPAVNTLGVSSGPTNMTSSAPGVPASARRLPLTHFVGQHGPINHATANMYIWDKLPTLKLLLEATLNAYVAATHARLSNISPRQYGEFLDFLSKAYDTYRMLPSGKGIAEFQNLLEVIRHSYRGKRKLMLLIAERFHL